MPANHSTTGTLPRIGRFLSKPWSEKKKSLYFRWISTFPHLPAPLRLPFGAWWLVRADNAGLPISQGKFEEAEIAFVGRFVKPGMTVLDIGAHHGLYTLLASKRTGPNGRVFSFEPSTRERNALLQHLRMNRCKNVTVEALAVGSENTDAQLYVVEGTQTGCNSLRKPAEDVSGTFKPLTVHVVKLDDWLASRKIEKVDFLKLDVEGGELEVLKGAFSLITGKGRPTILAEVQDVRTLPWGYNAIEIIDYLKAKGYVWFTLRSNGSVEKANLTSAQVEGNFVACPAESLGVLKPYKT
jgi:FkbM family methyltransferase